MSAPASTEILRKAYAAFNTRDLDSALATMAADVEWPNGMEGGTVHGHDGVRAYWTRQWGMLDPHVEPKAFEDDDAGRIIVSVHQVVRELTGKLLFDRMVEHVYSLKNGLITRMEIRE
jgi:hypothetical protein